MVAKHCIIGLQNIISLGIRLFDRRPAGFYPAELAASSCCRATSLGSYFFWDITIRRGRAAPSYPAGHVSKLVLLFILALRGSYDLPTGSGNLLLSRCCLAMGGHSKL